MPFCELGVQYDADTSLQSVFKASMHRVLVVDDERVIASTLVEIFQHAGYQARSAYSAEEALDVIADWTPDVAIIDVILPKTSGVDLAIMLKAQFPQCGISLFSGAPEAADVVQASRHAFQILAKPAHPTELLALASELLRPKADVAQEVVLPEQLDS
jgi:DNA-binding response OmpR family regulator